MKIYTLNSNLSSKSSDTRKPPIIQQLSSTKFKILMVGAMLVCITLTTNLYLAFKFEKLKVFDQYNVLFDTDPNERLKCFIAGHGGMGRTLAHPNLCNFVNPPIRVAAKVSKAIKVIESEPNARRIISLTVTPILSSLAVFLTYFTLIEFGLGVWNAGIISGFIVVAFSQLIFGSIPDHFAISGFGLAATFLTAARSLRKKRFPMWQWVGCGTLMTSISITNVVITAILSFFCLTKLRNFKFAIPRTFLLALLSILLTFGFKLSFDSLYSTRENSSTTQLQKIKNWTGGYFKEDPLNNLLSFSSVIGRVVAVSGLEVKPLEIRPLWTPKEKAAMIKAPYQFIFFLGDKPPAKIDFAFFLSIVVVGCIVAGSVLIWTSKNSKVSKEIILSCWGIILYNGIFHSFWGAPYLLFSQHWLIASIIPFTGLIQSSIRSFTWRHGALLALLVAVGINNLIAVDQILDLLGSTIIRSAG